MITPDEFVRRWQGETWPPGEVDPLVRFPKVLVDGLQISQVDKEFLLRAGLPERAGSLIGGNR